MRGLRLACAARVLLRHLREHLPIEASGEAMITRKSKSYWVGHFGTWIPCRAYYGWAAALVLALAGVR